MVPKSGPTVGSKKRSSNKGNDQFSKESDSESECSYEDELPSNKVVDYEGENNLLEAATKTEFASKKRKLKVEEEGSDNDNDTPELQGNTPIKKKKKKKKLSSVNMKPPTAEEMTRLRETENLFHSNLFRMQIEEMIKEVRPKKNERKQMKPWLEGLKELLLNIDDSSPPELNETCLMENIKSPLPLLPNENLKVTSSFHRPESVSVVGSYSAGCSLGPSLLVDVVVVMPKKCFLKDDYLNARYHKKRALYLSYLASILQGSSLINLEQGVSWIPFCGHLLSPQLVVSPAEKLSKVKVFISAVPQSGTFKLSRFTAGKNNIRESWLTEGKVNDCGTDTPIYNTSMMREMVWSANESIRQQVLEHSSNLKDAIILLKVWLRQRQLDKGLGGFSGYLISMLVVGLLQSRRLNNLMSSYQIVRNVWLVLSQTDWTKEGFTLCSTKPEENTPSLKEFHDHFDVVFVDTTGYCNLAADVHSLTYFKVKQECQLAIQCLDNPDMNSFQALFMTPLPFLHQFDHVISIRKNKKTVSKVLTGSTEGELINHFATHDSLFTNVVVRLLQRGLGTRVEQLVFELSPVSEWPITEMPPQPDKTLRIGLKLNPDTAYSVVEKGPPANEPQAAEFRALWGKRCELRRFRDGTVCEAVVWAEPTAPLSSRRLVTKQMVLSLLHSSLGLSDQTVIYLADQLEPLVTEKAFIPDGFSYGSGEEASHRVIEVFDRLAKQLRELPDLPLDVASVQGVSAVFRGTDVFPPLAGSGRPQAKAGLMGKTSWLLDNNIGKAPEYIAAVEGVLQLGLSRKWPEDPEAVRRIRAAFNLHIAKALLETFDLQTQAFPDHVDIFKEGFVFRIHVVYPREVALLKQTTTPDGKLCYRDTPESLQLEKYTLHLPKLTGVLHGVQKQWPAFSVTCRLAKRWLSSQLLDSAHMPDVATELLVASLFLSSEPFRPLAQPQTMFLRFLHYLVRTNWYLEPVIVNFNGDLKREDLMEIESHFHKERASLPSLFIATQNDKYDSIWTREAPTLPVLVRMASLARESFTLLEKSFLSTVLFEECKVVFRPPMELYDALIHLKPLLLARLIHAVDYATNSPYTLETPQRRKLIPITGFDPAQSYLKELRESYSEYALFFHDTYGGKTIGVLFKPSAFEKQEFKVSHVNCRKPINENKKTLLELNFDAIIEDFYILGAGLVKTIDVSPKYSQRL